MIYVIEEGLNGQLKIGTTVNLEERLKTLQGGNSKQLSVIMSFKGGSKLREENGDRLDCFCDCFCQGRKILTDFSSLTTCAGRIRSKNTLVGTLHRCAVCAPLL